MIITKQLAGWICAAILAVAAPMAQANLVVDGNFTAGGGAWSLSTNAVINSNTTHTSPNSVRFGGSDTDAATASQSVTLEAIKVYELSFFLTGNRSAMTISYGGTALDFSSNCLLCDIRDPDPIADLNDPSGIWYQYFTAIEMLPSSLLEFSFSAGANADAVFLDDVSITCVDNCTPGNGNNQTPEPGSLLLVGAALAGLAVARKRKQV